MDIWKVHVVLQLQVPSMKHGSAILQAERAVSMKAVVSWHDEELFPIQNLTYNGIFQPVLSARCIAFSLHLATSELSGK